MTQTEQVRQEDRAERLMTLLNRRRSVLDGAVGAFNVGRESLTVFAIMLTDRRQWSEVRLDAALTAAVRVREAAGAFLDMVAASQEEAARPPARYRVTCPDCGAANLTSWVDDPPPGGVSPVKCAQCGYQILSESEGNPQPVPPEPEAAPENPAPGDPGEAAPAASERKEHETNVDHGPLATAANVLLRKTRTSVDAAVAVLGEGDDYVRRFGAELEGRVEAVKGHLKEGLKSSEMALSLARIGEEEGAGDAATTAAQDAVAPSAVN